jgi:protein-tyrosine-phosphatase
VDLSAHRSRVARRPDITAGLLAVGMTPGQARRAERAWGLAHGQTLVLGDLDPLPVERRSIPDPWRQPEEAFVAAYERIDRCVRVLVEAVFGQPE